MKKSLLILSLALLGFPAYAAEPLSDSTRELTVDLSPVELPERRVLISQGIPNEEADLVMATNNTSTKVIVVPNISTSRPSFTDAVTTVPQGSLQAENGATYTDNRGGSYSWTTPETLLRLGLTDNTELRFTTPNYTYIGDNQPGSLSNNFGDISVGLSHHFVAPGKIDVALIPILNIPSGANKVSTNSVDPQFRLVLAKNITSKWLISSHLDTRWNTGRNASAEVVFNPTLINYYSFTKKLTGFLEYSGFYPTTGKTTQFLQSGAIYLLTPRQQVDVRLATGLNNNSPNILVGFGYSFRIDGLFGTSRAFSSFK
jgi:hypothetical protein